MSEIVEVPWADSSLEAPEDFFALIPRHWPHYTTITMEYAVSWNASFTFTFPDVIEGDPPEIECAAVTVTDTSIGSLSGTITWTRQSSGDEMSEQDLATGEFLMRMIFEGNVSVSPRIDSALFHRATLATGDTLTGSYTQVIHTGDACDVVTTTTTADFTASPAPSDLGVYESGTNTWAKKLGTITGLYEGGGTASPIPLPTLTTAFVTSLAGNPNGADIVFTDSDTVTTPDTGFWHGSSSASFTLTLST